MKKSSKTLWAFLIALVSVFGSSTVGWAADLNYDGNPFRLSTDKCLYAPGEQVAFNYDGTLPSGARVRYYRGSEVIGEESLSGTQWRWTAPQRNFTGYLAVVYVPGSNNKETIYSTIAVDVSSSWGKFPRYGFVATYDDSKTKSTIQAETSWLNRCHINGIQYYDWQYLHEIPYDKHGHRDEWTDLANRKIRADVVRNYISEHHRYGMKAMFYNLLFGADPGYGDRGVSWDWGMFKDGEQDYHPLPDGWRGPIYLCDPSNKSWQNYLIEKNNDVYEAFDFDGYHIDQLGYRGTVTNRAGGEIPLTWAYSDFINSMKKARPDKLLVMNAVSNYGSSEIISTGNVEFSYTELWGSEESYWDMERMVREHAEVDGRCTASVFAAYMDYNRRDNGGEYFNTPGILLTDATMFAVGGSHLELGDGHMLCAEYFPNSNLRMSDELISSLTKYYDFMTAYENYLRDGGSVVDPQISCTNGVVDINRWPPSTGRVTAYSRQLDGRKVINLLNFSSTRDEKHTLLRDVDGDMPEPALKQNIKVKVYSEKASKVWVASPDRFDGVPQQLSFSRSGNYIEFNVPSLKYWTMIVIEQDGSVQPTPEPTPSDYTLLYLVGDNTPGKWNLKEATPLQPTSASGIYSATLRLTSSGSFKIATDRDGDYTQKFFFRDATNSGKISEDGTGDRQWTVGEDGDYTVTVDMNQMTISIEKQGSVQPTPDPTPSAYTSLYLVGDNTPGGWKLWEATPLQPTSASGIYSATLPLTANGSFKIATDKDGDYSQKFYFRDRSNSGRISEDASGDRQWTVGEDGSYVVTVDMNQMTISIVKQAGSESLFGYYGVLYLVGDNTPGQWRLWEATPLVQAGNTFYYTAMLPLTASGSFKIATDKDGDYSQKFFFRDANNSGLISEDATDDRQWSVGEDGYYKVAVDLKDGSIYINKVTANMLKGYSELNDATTIGRIDAAVGEDNSYYTLSGVKVQKPTRGIYIVGGRKVIVK
ncbi:MAG: SusF/SusE family outer membrane protein [Prevotella sp.]|nr:SusF/SusE family outer membrane protein [Prevotella sp.]